MASPRTGPPRNAAPPGADRAGATPPVPPRLSAESCAALFEVGRRVELQPGQAFFRQGDATSTVGIVLRGHIKLTAVGSSGRSVLLSFWGPGDFAGLVTALNDTTYLGTAIAMGPVEAWAIAVDRLRDLLADSHELNAVLVRQLAAQAEATARSQCAQGTDPARVRIARLLAELSDRPIDSPGDAQLRLDFSQDELGQIIGVSRESMARELRALREEGVVSTGRRRLIVHRPDRLRELGQMAPLSGGGSIERLVRLPSG